jgi:hypothetical protein
LVGDQARTRASRRAISLTSVDGETLTDAHQLVRRMDSTASGAVVVLETVRQGRSRTVTVSVSQQAQAQPPLTSQPKKVGQQPRRLGLRLAPAGRVGVTQAPVPGRWSPLLIQQGSQRAKHRGVGSVADINPIH